MNEHLIPNTSSAAHSSPAHAGGDSVDLKASFDEHALAGSNCLRTGSVGVVVCAYSEHRWEPLAEALESVRRQTRPPDQIIVVVDHNTPLLDRTRKHFTDVTVVASCHERGLSGARNTGVGLVRGEIVAFLDDDARARPTWLAELLDGYADGDVVGTGGGVAPRWISGARPRWLPEEFYWTVGCSYRGLPIVNAPIRNPIGANMSFRRDAIVRAGGFRDGIGRTEVKPLGCEETELAIRITNLVRGARILHVPAAVVDHRVEADRVNWRYFRSRCWAEGLSKATVADCVGRAKGLASERRYALWTLPSGVARGLSDAVRADRMGLVRAAAIVVGFAVTAAGYVRGRLAGAHAARVEVGP